VTDHQSSTGGLAGRRGPRRDALANQERVLAAAVTTMLREGRHVPMATIATEAGVGVGTLYRRYPTREALLEALTERSFRMVLAAAQEASMQDGTALSGLDLFFEQTIAHRHELILPLHGGPVDLSPGARAVRAQLHDALARLLERGRSDGSVQDDVTTRDVVMLGAMLAQPLPGIREWASIARRQKQLFLRGIAGAVVGEQSPSTSE
jgi:AcrR family transcriptional regulator